MDDSDPTMRWFLGSQRPKYRRDRAGRGPRAEVPVPVDVDKVRPLMSDLERMVNEHSPGLRWPEVQSRARLWDFHGFTAETAREWLKGSIFGLARDIEKAQQLRDAGVTPKMAFSTVVQHGKPTSYVFWDLVTDGTLKPSQVREIFERRRPDAKGTA